MICGNVNISGLQQSDGFGVYAGRYSMLNGRHGRPA
jgi:hypothetical protein